MDWAGFDWTWLNTVGGAIASVIAILLFLWGLVVAGLKLFRWFFVPRQGAPVLADHRPAPANNRRKIFGRDTEIKALHDLLNTQGQGAVIPVPTGGGGVGKTSLCLEYARVHADDYARVTVLRAGTEDELIADLAALAKTLDPTLPEEAGLRALAIQAKSMIAERAADARWLLIYDNVERPQIMVDWGISGAHLHVLVTSRDPDWRLPGYAPKPLGVLKPEDALELLRHESGRDDPGLDDLARELGHLPLSLVQAGEWLAATPSLSPADYLKRIDYLRKRVRVPGLDTDLGRTTSAVVTETMARLSADATALAQIFAWYAPDQLHAGLVSGLPQMSWRVRLRDQYGKHIPRRIYAMAQDPDRLHGAMVELRRVALLEAQETTDAPLRMHRDFQRVIRLSGAPRDVPRFSGARAAAAVLAAQFPYRVDFVEHWPTCRALLPHLRALWDQAAGRWDGVWNRPDWPAMDYLLNQAGIYLSRQSDRPGAIVLGRASLDLKRARLPETDRDVPLAMGNLALDLAATGDPADLAEAQKLIDRAVALNKAHRQGDARADLAGSYMQQAMIACARIEAGGDVAGGAAAVAEAALDAAQQIWRDLFGPDSAEMSYYWNELGNFRRLTGQGDAALDAYAKGLRILQPLPGADRGNLATYAMNIGSMALELGRWDQALDPLQLAYDIRTQAFDHDPGNPKLRTTCGWLIACHLVRHRAGQAGARAAAEALCAKHGFDLAKVQAKAATYPLTPEGGSEEQ